MEPALSPAMEAESARIVEALGDEMNKLIIENPPELHNESSDTIDYNSIDYHTHDESSEEDSRDYDEESSDECYENNNDDAVFQQSDASSEDWDSDSYWQPPYHIRPPSPKPSFWVYFTKKKMEEGNFCPVDMHAPSVMEKIVRERKLNPKVVTIVEGQFDDLSEDDS